MRINEKGQHRISFIITLLLHVGVLFLSLPDHWKAKAKIPENYKIPAQFIVKEIKIPPKTTKGSYNTKKGSSSVISASKSTAKVKSKPPKPKRLPGDRDEPEVIGSSKRNPVVPKVALNYNWHGTVKAEFTINKAGRVTRYRVVKSSGHEVLDNAFVKTVQTYWVFKPKRVLGKDQAAKIRISHTFPKLQ